MLKLQIHYHSFPLVLGAVCSCFAWGYSLYLCLFSAASVSAISILFYIFTALLTVCIPIFALLLYKVMLSLFGKPTFLILSQNEIALPEMYTGTSKYRKRLFLIPVERISKVVLVRARNVVPMTSIQIMYKSNTVNGEDLRIGFAAGQFKNGTSDLIKAYEFFRGKVKVEERNI